MTTAGTESMPYPSGRSGKGRNVHGLNIADLRRKIHMGQDIPLDANTWCNFYESHTAGRQFEYSPFSNIQDNLFLL